MATYSWNFTTAATLRALPVDTPTLGTRLAGGSSACPCGWLPAPSQPSSCLPPVSYRRVSGGDLYPAASPSLALFSVAERDEQGNRKQRREMSTAPVFTLVSLKKDALFVTIKLSLVSLHKDFNKN